MKFEQYGKEIENLKIETNPLDFAESNVFKKLTILFGYIKKNKSEIYESFIEKITGKIKKLAKNEYFKNEPGKLIERIKKCELLTENQDLVISHLDAFIERLGITKEQFWENKKIKVPAGNFNHSVNDLYYQHLTTFVEILGKEEAIKLYKEIVNEYIWTYDTNQNDIFKDLEDMREKFIRWTQNIPLGRVRLISDVENGQWIKICKNCEKVQSLDDWESLDGELMYAIACYCHLPLAEMWNGNFVLTLKECIAKGDPFCAYVYHDKSIVDKIEHPPREFFEKIFNELISKLL